MIVIIFFFIKDNILYDESIEASVKSIHLKWLHSSNNMLSLLISDSKRLVIFLQLCSTDLLSGYINKQRMHPYIFL